MGDDIVCGSNQIPGYGYDIGVKRQKLSNMFYQIGLIVSIEPMRFLGLDNFTFKHWGYALDLGMGGDGGGIGGSLIFLGDRYGVNFGYMVGKKSKKFYEGQCNINRDCTMYNDTTFIQDRGFHFTIMRKF